MTTAQTTTTATAQPASPTPSPLDSDTEGVICAGLNTLKFSGDTGSDAVDTVASAQEERRRPIGQR